MPRVEAGWIDGIKYDGIFIFGIAGIAILSGLIIFLKPSMFLPVLVIDLLLLSYHHVIATFTKLAGTADDRKENRFLIYLLPFISLATVIALYGVFGVFIIATIYFFWQWYHYIRQGYGIAVFYRRKSKKLPKKNTVISQLAIWAIPIWGILNRCGQGWEEFLFLPFYVPKVPEWLVTFAGFVAVGSVVLWVLNKCNEYRKNILSLAQTSFVVSHMLIFYVGYVLIPDLNTGWLVVNIWHSAQYLMFVWLFHVNRHGKLEKTQNVLSMRTIANREPLKILTYFCVTLAMTFVFFGGLNIGIELVSSSTGILLSNIVVIGYQTVNFHHFVVDSLIWKARNKKNRKAMNIS